MATITTPTEAKTSDDSSLISHIVGMWARTTPVLSAILTRFVSETGLKSLMSDSTTLDDSNKIASSKAVKNANRRYVAENYTDGAPSTPVAGSIALGRGGKWIINGDGHLTTTSTSFVATDLEISCLSIAANEDTQNVSLFGTIGVGTGFFPLTQGGITSTGIIQSTGTVKGLKLEAGTTGITSSGTIQSTGTVKGLKLEAGNTGITSTGTIESTGTVKGLKLEAGTTGITSSGHIDAGVKQVRGANISKFTAKFRRGSSGFSLVKEFSESGFTITYPDSLTIIIHHGSVSFANFTVLTALKMQSELTEHSPIMQADLGGGDHRIRVDNGIYPVGSDLVLDFIY